MRRGSDAESKRFDVSPTPTPSHTISVEDIFSQIGGFSTFQVFAMFVIMSPELVAAMVALSPIITGSSDVPFVCEGEYGEPLFTISGKDVGSLEVCNGTLKPEGSVLTSVVQEWMLIADKSWVSDLFTSVQMFGSMIGALASSNFSEKFGRKSTHFGLSLLMGISSFASAWTYDPVSYAITRGVAGFAVGGCFVVYMNYLMEFLIPSFRTVCGCVSLWAVGEMLLALLAYKIQNWRYLTAVTGLPILLIFAIYPWFPESPRWLLCKEKTSQALEVFDKIAHFNGKKAGVDPVSVKNLQNSISSLSSSSSTASSFSYLKFLRRKGFRLQLLALMLAWFTCQLIYYGISFNMKHLVGDPYWNIFYMGLLDLPGSFTGILFNNRFGRKKTFISFLSIASLFLLVLIVVDTTDLSLQHPFLVNVVSLSARYFISAAFGVIACLTGESFPTVGRIGCVGLCALCGNIGGILAPQFAFIGTIAKSVHFITFGCLSLVTVALSFTLKESVGRPLQDVPEDEEEEDETKKRTAGSV